MPTSSIVRRSASRICAAVSTRMIVKLSTAKDAEERRINGTLSSVSATVNVNGRVFDQEHAVISVFDHGFLYGEGVYETLRTYNGRPFLFDRHMRRLRASAGMVALDVPIGDAEIDARFRETMRAAGLGESTGREAYIRILVTRGIGELTYDLAACPNPSIVVIVKPNVEPSR